MSETPTVPQEAPEVSAVMPCLNEVRTLQVCIEKAQRFFREAGIAGEVVVADNGSTDGSQELARSLGARVIDVPRRGYGAALMGGIEGSRGSIIVMGDADDSYDWSAIGPFVEGIRGGSDLVMGNRFKGGIKKGAMSFSHRWIGNPVLSFIARVAFRAPIGDFHSGMRAITPAAYRQMQLRTPGMEFATEMVANAVLAGLKMSEVPVTLYPDGRDRPPHLNTVRDGWRHLRFITTYAPDLLFLMPSFVMLGLGVALMLLLSRGPLDLGPIHLGIHWLVIGSMLTLSGLALFVYGVLAKTIIRRTHGTFDSRLVSWVLERFRLEHGLIVGLVLAGVGFLIDSAILAGFIATGGGASEQTVHPAIVATTMIAAGLQICFASFLMRLMAEESSRA